MIKERVNTKGERTNFQFYLCSSHLSVVKCLSVLVLYAEKNILNKVKH